MGVGEEQQAGGHAGILPYRRIIVSETLVKFPVRA
jgi:hypothetical protein